jgi:hypothetical protein
MMIPYLLGSLYKAFDKSPHAVAGLRISHEDGVSWSISDRWLTVRTELDVLVGSYSLEAHTIDSLAEALVSDGCTIVYQNVDKSHLSASILLEGSGIETQESNGNLLLAYDSYLWTFLDAYAYELEIGKAAIPEAIKQIIYVTAESDFLDYWGEYWGFPRLINESDNDYRERTIDEITRKRSNAIAIEQNIERITHVRHEVREPWKEFMNLSDDGRMSDDKHLTGLEWQYHVAQVVGWGPTLDTADNIANRDRPAGTLFIPPRQKYPGSGNEFPPIDIIFWQEWLYGYYVEIGLTGILSENLVLSGYVDLFTADLAISDLLVYSNEDGLNDISMMYWNVYCKGEIILSDSDPLGTLQAHFGGRELRDSGDLQVLSDVGLISDSDYTTFWVPIDEWSDDDRAYYNVMEYDFAGIMGREEIFGFDEITVLQSVTYGWTGNWDQRHWKEVITVPIVITNTPL